MVLEKLPETVSLADKRGITGRRKGKYKVTHLFIKC